MTTKSGDKGNNKQRPKPVAYASPEDAYNGVLRAGKSLGEAYMYACERIDFISDILDDLDPEEDAPYMNELILNAQAIEGEWILDDEHRTQCV